MKKLNYYPLLEELAFMQKLLKDKKLMLMGYAAIYNDDEE